MAFKIVLFVPLLVAAMALPLADAQLGNLLPPLLGLFRIQGTVFCTANGSVSVGGNAATPVFPNATVQLQCGAGNGVSTVTANASGVFSILLDPLHFLLSSLLTGCRLVVTTPLATCNASLPPSGVLISALQFFGTTLVGALSVINVTPVGFTLQV
ncbi:hypothetical protein PRUPE_1G133700 [Prunus persica]|uniref:Phylloplanin n=1 Tax=Prunus persica TaxID=3760 RepID=M5XVK7_PRUPE|nr:phylloplanin [Prunus persica]ONI28243.1 hypothetical protein PRUPE_1G133700 [Prunus persica]